MKKTEWKVCRRPRRTSRLERKPYFSINRHGDIAFNALGWKAIDETYNVGLLFDAGSRRIGLRIPTSADPHNLFPVRRRGPRMRVVRAAKLLAQFEIKITDTLTFTEPEREADILVLDLTTAVLSKRGRHHWRRQDQNA